MQIFTCTFECVFFNGLKQKQEFAEQLYVVDMLKRKQKQTNKQKTKQNKINKQRQQHQQQIQKQKTPNPQDPKRHLRI